MKTPRTDKYKFRIGDSGHFAIHEIYARQLETELESERERSEKLKDTIRRARTKFCEVGSDGKIAAEMFQILGESREETK